MAILTSIVGGIHVADIFDRITSLRQILPADAVRIGSFQRGGHGVVRDVTVIFGRGKNDQGLFEWCPGVCEDCRFWRGDFGNAAVTFVIARDSARSRESSSASETVAGVDKPAAAAGSVDSAGAHGDRQ